MFVGSQVIVECASTCFAAGGLSSVLSVAERADREVLILRQTDRRRSVREPSHFTGLLSALWILLEASTATSIFSVHETGDSGSPVFT